MRYGGWVDRLTRRDGTRLTRRQIRRAFHLSRWQWTRSWWDTRDYRRARAQAAADRERFVRSLRQSGPLRQSGRHCPSCGMPKAAILYATGDTPAPRCADPWHDPRENGPNP